MKQKIIKLRVGRVTGGTGVVESIIQGLGIIVNSTDPANPIVSSESLQIIDEGNGDGYRIIGRDDNNYGSIGLGAFDFSLSSLPSITVGARGTNSFAVGNTTIALNTDSFASGKFNVGTDINTIFEIGIGADDANRLNAFEAFLDGTLTAPDSTIAEITARGDKALITKEFADVTYVSSQTNPTGLELITENSKSGWRYIGRDDLNYGDIGTFATDLSTSETVSGTLGSRGDYSLVAGFETTATQAYAIAFGFQTVAFREGSFATGYQTTTNGLYAAAFGLSTLASGNYSLVQGDNTIALNYASVAIGKWNVGSALNTIFEIGVGVSGIDKRNALEVFTGGNILAPELLIANIDAEATGKILVTKEWVTAKALPTGLEAIDESNGFGWRYIGRDNLDYGSIGLDATDLSISTGTNGTNIGATANAAFAAGIDTHASDQAAVTFGIITDASGIAAMAIGTLTSALEDYSLATGQGTRAINIASSVFGKWNVGTDINTIFEIGVGTSDIARLNVFEVFTTGEIIAPEITNALIDSEATGKILVTKEWVTALPTSANDYLTAGIFNTVNGELTLNIQNQSDVVIDLDGRYLESFTETDPIFIASSAFGITGTQITNWDEAYGWGDHAGLYSLLGHTHFLTAITDVTATSGEVNLLDLGGMTSGFVLAADAAAAASWRPLLGSELTNDLGWTTGTGDVTAGLHAANRVAVWTATANEIDGSANFVFTDVGLLGVGTGNPQERLDVAGNVLADAYIVDGGFNTDFLMGDGSLISTFPADIVTYDNTSGLTATDVQAAIDEIAAISNVTLPQVYEAVVSFNGNNTTGAVGGLPFATPTAAAAALRAYIGSQRLMTIQAGTYVAEDCLFPDGILSCEPGVTLQTGSTNAMFENIDGSYDGIDYQVVGMPDLAKTGAHGQFNITTSLGTLDVTGSIIGLFTTTNISADNLNLVLSEIGGFTIKANNAIINIVDITNGFSFLLECIDSSLGTSVIGNIDLSLNIKANVNATITSTTTNKATIKTNITSYANPILNYNGNSDFKIYNELNVVSSNMNIIVLGDDINTTDYIFSGRIVRSGGDNTKQILTIVDNCPSKIDLSNLFLEHKDGGECITSNTQKTIDVSGSLTMITTASPKIGANITINDIQDY